MWSIFQLPTRLCQSAKIPQLFQYQQPTCAALVYPTGVPAPLKHQEDLQGDYLVDAPDLSGWWAGFHHVSCKDWFEGGCILKQASQDVQKGMTIWRKPNTNSGDVPVKAWIIHRKVRKGPSRVMPRLAVRLNDIWPLASLLSRAFAEWSDECDHRVNICWTGMHTCWTHLEEHGSHPSSPGRLASVCRMQPVAAWRSRGRQTYRGYHNLDHLAWCVFELACRVLVFPLLCPLLRHTAHNGL